jgi:hypothetical protein
MTERLSIVSELGANPNKDEPHFIRLGKDKGWSCSFCSNSSECDFPLETLELPSAQAKGEEWNEAKSEAL